MVFERPEADQFLYLLSCGKPPCDHSHYVSRWVSDSHIQKHPQSVNWQGRMERPHATVWSEIGMFLFNVYCPNGFPAEGTTSHAVSSCRMTADTLSWFRSDTRIQHKDASATSRQGGSRHTRTLARFSSSMLKERGSPRKECSLIRL
jgi:hypothetical protein